MKRLTQILLLAIIGLSLSSCSKIVEDKIAGTYRLDRAFKNGSDYTQTFNTLMANYKLVLADGGTYVISYVTIGINQNESGNWSVSDKGKKITIVPSDTNKEASIWTIMERKKDFLKVQYSTEGDVYEYHLKKD